VFPIGSFYSSIIANLLPAGVGSAVRDAECPKLYVPNTGVDPEQVGTTIEQRVETILRYLRKDASADTPTERLLQFVLLDESVMQRTKPSSLQAIKALGIQVVGTRLVSEVSAPDLDPELLARALVSLG
jgi:2-phospho-L-lactate transferase/gluconeogenesis factor (CofD/UPF0052 family)